LGCLVAPSAGLRQQLQEAERINKHGTDVLKRFTDAVAAVYDHGLYTSGKRPAGFMPNELNRRSHPRYSFGSKVSFPPHPKTAIG